jgi:serine/threonine protein kinase
VSARCAGFVGKQEGSQYQRQRARRYEVVKASGKGVFSSVVTARDKLRQDAAGGNPLVAVKMIRANNTMYKAGKLELEILNTLADKDPDNRKHVVRLLRSFEYRNHLCMVRRGACSRLCKPGRGRKRSGARQC